MEGHAVAGEAVEEVMVAVLALRDFLVLTAVSRDHGKRKQAVFQFVLFAAVWAPA